MTETTLPMAVAVLLLAVLCLSCLSHLFPSWNFGPDRWSFPEQLARVKVKEALSGKRFDA